MRRVGSLERLWCWEGLGAGGEGDDRGWDGWMASLTRWTWVWVNSGSWWWTGRPGVLRFMGSQRVGHDWATELTELNCMRAVLVPKGACPHHAAYSWLKTPNHSVSAFPQQPHPVTALAPALYSSEQAQTCPSGPGIWVWSVNGSEHLAGRGRGWSGRMG